MRNIPFTKTEAHGNDFLLVSEHELPLSRSDEGARLARAICHRRSGVGAWISAMASTMSWILCSHLLGDIHGFREDTVTDSRLQTLRRAEIDAASK